MHGREGLICKNISRIRFIKTFLINSFVPNAPLRFSDVFRGYRKGALGKIGLTSSNLSKRLKYYVTIFYLEYLSFSCLARTTEEIK